MTTLIARQSPRRSSVRAATPIGRSARIFIPGLLALTVLGIATRVLFVIGWTKGTPVVGDSLFYQLSAAHIAHGAGYVWILPGSTRLTATAQHPPLFPLVLAALDSLGIRSPDAHRIALAVICAGAIVLTGLAGRRLAGPTVGLLAAAVAALDPLWIQPSGLLMSESIYLIIVPLVVLIGLLCVDRPSPWTFALLGISIGVATLTRAEALGLLILLGVPLLVRAVRSWGSRFRFGLALLAGVSLLVGPWLIRNEVALGALTLSSDQGSALAGSYCTDTFVPDRPSYGSFSARCAYGAAGIILLSPPPRPAASWTEPTLDDALTSGASRFVQSHVNDLPGALLARDAKLWGLFAPTAQLNFDVAEGRVHSFEQVGEIVNWVLLALAGIGTVELARRARPYLAVVAGPILLVTLTAAIFYASTRMRVAAEPAVAALGAIGAVWLYRRKWAWQSVRGPRVVGGRWPLRGGW